MPNSKDLIGNRYGKLVVISKTTDRTSNGKVIWECECDCGKTHNYSTDRLNSGKAKSCGCLRHPDLTGQKFGKLTVTGMTDRTSKNGSTIWACECECGKVCERSTRSLKPDINCSCGCSRNIDLTGQKLGKLEVVRRLNVRNSNGNVLWECRCACGNICNKTTGHLQSGYGLSCGCINDLSGKKFGHLNVVNKTDKRTSGGSVLWKCKCDCEAHTVCYFTTSELSNLKGSCGCSEGRPGAYGILATKEAMPFHFNTNPSDKENIKEIDEIISEVRYIDECNPEIPMEEHSVILDPSDFSDGASIDLLEGNPNVIIQNKYERNPIARQKCIEYHGCYCKICGFDFEKTFGDIGQYFIHVHHRVPLSQVGKKHIINYKNDLIPVCPNCHVMLHKLFDNRYLSVEDLVSILCHKP